MHHAKYAPIVQPAAGADWVWTPSATDPVMPVTIMGLLTTSATADTRVPAIQMVGQDGEIVFQTAASVGQAASLADYWSFVAASNGASYSGLYAAGASINTVAFPQFFVPYQWKIQAKTYLLQTGDQWSGLYAVYYDLTDYSAAELGALAALGS